MEFDLPLSFEKEDVEYAGSKQTKKDSIFFCFFCVSQDWLLIKYTSSKDIFCLFLRQVSKTTTLCGMA